MSSVFGNMFPSSSLVADVVITMQKWFLTYLRECEDQAGLQVGNIPEPLKYTNRNKYDATIGEQLPRCAVVCPGTIGIPLKSGNGQYRAAWRVGIGVAMSAETEEEADIQTKIYAAVVRAVMLQKQGEYGSNNTEWLEEAYDDLPLAGQLKQYKACAVWFSVDVEDVVTKKKGPLTPNDAPYGIHTADLVIIDLEVENVAD